MTVNSSRLRVGIFFGGPSREREVSFAGGRTVYDNLNKSLFEPVPIFVDSLGRFILLRWSFIYKGSIRDFYPPVTHLPRMNHEFQLYIESLGHISDADWQRMAHEVGVPLYPHQFSDHFDLAFVTLHGLHGEDGSLQGLLEWYAIPYTGSGIFPSAVGIDKSLQRALLRDCGFASPDHHEISWAQWQSTDRPILLNHLCRKLGTRFVVKSAHQGSSIGVTVLQEPALQDFELAVNRSFFVEQLAPADWLDMSDEGKHQYLAALTDIRSGIGLPVEASAGGEKACFYLPDGLWKWLDSQTKPITLRALSSESVVIFEQFIEGLEFSCIVIEGEDRRPLALPPTEIRKSLPILDYRAKYLPGLSRKITPSSVDNVTLRKIQSACCQLFEKLHFEVYARLDGFLTPSGEIFLNDPNTTSGMLPSSFFFHQAAEIGLNPSQFLTLIIRTSLAARLRNGKHVINVERLLSNLDDCITNLEHAESSKTRVAVLLGGYSTERHISVESGRNVFEKLSSSAKYAPVPVFLTGNPNGIELYQIPTNLLLKDNADDIREKIHKALKDPVHSVTQETIKRAAALTKKYAQQTIFRPLELTFEGLEERTDVAFIALHGRPGEDGHVQARLEAVGIPYNGSRPKSAQITIDKFETIKLLRQSGFAVARHALVEKSEWVSNAVAVLDKIETRFSYPLIAKPVDDGCSSAVKKITDRAQLVAFARQIFREDMTLLAEQVRVLALAPGEEFPVKSVFLVEELIGANGADHFLEVTGGLLTKHGRNGPVYEMFEPSESVASAGILSLDEKFLAGEGLNVTPARFASDKETSARLSRQVQAELERAARVLGIEGYARIDAFVRVYGERAETVVIEANSLPGMTPATAIFHQTALQGYTPYEFIDRILQYAVQHLATELSAVA
ncbi:D-alanine--D-alanine ligase [Gracilariopsis chorda]|uniref:D-alanine--D-alanine ligase n=1 Tax=Gracilariopsis chorda TaxID=448386 RepID=A0A2V3IR02_9FLOR|nr:D-alanine--D-alanine ligase [Gracilariopsis chorda]|eukprot:PXF44538.1 D-alanine--D-alanine ligase [Gracilariopsis chorda]